MGLIVHVSLPLILFVLLSILGQCEMSIYPGLRRKPLSQALQHQAFEMSEADFLSQLMEENARRRLQQQFEQQLELIHMRLDRQRQREKVFRRREQERQRFKQNQLQRHRQKQQELMNEDDWRELKEAGDSMAAEDNVEYATTYTYNKSKNRNRPYSKYETATENSMGNYNYKYPNMQMSKANNLRERIPFAVPPSDPRFFEEDNRSNNEKVEYDESDESETADETVHVVNDNGSIESDEDIDLRTLDEYEEYVPLQSTPPPLKVGSENVQHNDNTVKSAPSFPAGATVAPTQSAAATFHRIKPVSALAAAAVVAGVKPPPGSPNVLRHDINALIDKLQKEDGSNSIIQDHGIEPHLVVRHYLGINDNDWGIYLVAILAGLSAAVTVGLIALGFSWVQNKTKAAADVEYPAYGVTGPNRDVSPSGDRKLAQSAQMYHYQHQKQQIMAMENRPVEGGLSDVESDDDNEEGDYTVYECPGLAPTGEMEVKNPLFLDETPVTTPSTTANASTPPVNAKATHVNMKNKKETPNDGKTSSESKKKETKK